MIPVISFCIPTFNRMNLLSKCIAEIQKIKYIDIEIIISDNNSEDGTFELVSKVALKDKRIKYYKNKSNIGGERNILKALSYAKGEYTYLTSDEDLINIDFFNNFKDYKKKNFSILFGSVYEPLNNKFYIRESNREFSNLSKVNNPHRYLFRHYITGFLLKTSLIDFELISTFKDIKNGYYLYSMAIMMCIKNGKILTTSEVISYKYNSDSKLNINSFIGTSNNTSLPYHNPLIRFEIIKNFISISHSIFYETKFIKFVNKAISRRAVEFYFHSQKLGYDSKILGKYLESCENEIALHNFQLFFIYQKLKIDVAQLKSRINRFIKKHLKS